MNGWAIGLLLGALIVVPALNRWVLPIECRDGFTPVVYWPDVVCVAGYKP